MRVSYNWLKDYVNINISPGELAEKLTMSGLEVDRVEYLAEGIENVVIGKILQVKNHPNAEKLLVCSVDIGNNILQIVTGAPNVKENILVPVALVGALLPNGIKIEKANFRGVSSYGMLCSSGELKLDFHQDPVEETGILVLQGDAPIGAQITDYFGLNDYVFEIELTPNRADCLSMINIAREVAIICEEELKLPEINLDMAGEQFPFTIDIEEQQLCNRYIALKIGNIELGPSPRWMQERLLAGGMRPINNVVDVTNYVMLETGQPLHAFDFDKLLNKKIVVRRARKNETIVTLDGNLRKLDPEMLLITDGGGPVAIAGVMGGLDSEVTNQTKTVLLESAHFDNMSVRKTARKLGLRSEASSRFEKGVDKEGAFFAACRALEILNKLAVNTTGGGKIDIYPVPWEAPVIALRTTRVNRILGVSLSTLKIKELLSNLNFKLVSETEDRLGYLIPSYRQDITREIDLIEEVARLYGYNNIEATLPYSEMKPEQKTSLQLLEEEIKNQAANLGLTEVVTYSFINPNFCDRLNLPPGSPWAKTIKMANPLSEEQSVMRTTLIPGLLSVCERNFNRRQKNLGIFEVGRAYFPVSTAALPQENLYFSALISGKFNPGWSWPVQDFDFYYLKGIVEKLVMGLMGKNPQFYVWEEDGIFHPARSAVLYISNQKIGMIGELHPTIQEDYGFAQKIYLAHLDLQQMVELEKEKQHYQPIPRFPNITRDMAVLLPEEIASQKVVEIITGVGKGLVSNYELFDVYRGPQIAVGYKSLAYGITYQGKSRTLTDKEVTELHEKIKETIKNELKAEFR